MPEDVKPSNPDAHHAPTGHSDEDVPLTFMRANGCLVVFTVDDPDYPMLKDALRRHLEEKYSHFENPEGR